MNEKMFELMQIRGVAGLVNGVAGVAGVERMPLFHFHSGKVVVTRLNFL